LRLYYACAGFQQRRQVGEKSMDVQHIGTAALKTTGSGVNSP